MKTKSIGVITKIGLLSAFAFLLYYLEFPLLAAFPFLKADVSEIPVLLGGFALGPVAGVIIELIKNLLHLFFKGETGGIGELMNFLLGISFLLPAVAIYRVKKSRTTALLGMLLGIVAACAAAALFNYAIFILIPQLFNITIWPLPEGGFINYLIAGSIPFTAIKYALNGVVVFIIYPYLSKLLHRA